MNQFNKLSMLLSSLNNNKIGKEFLYTHTNKHIVYLQTVGKKYVIKMTVYFSCEGMDEFEKWIDGKLDKLK